VIYGSVISGNKSSHIWSVPWREDIGDYRSVIVNGVFDTVEHGEGFWEFSEIKKIIDFFKYFYYNVCVLYEQII
jgi:hypothetical protein